MPSIYTQRIFVPGCYYHVYNRGAHQKDLFLDTQDYEIFTQILAYYLLHPLGTPKSILSRLAEDKERTLVKQTEGIAYTLLCYCLMPNHFHLMLKQESEDITISNLMKRLCTTYAMCFNNRHHHSGTIFQGKYKNVLIENEYQWLYLSKYIHRNPTHLQRTDPCPLSDYPYSSYPNYLGRRSQRWVNTSIILDENDKDPIGDYQRFVENDSEAGKIEKMTLDSDEIQS